MHTTAAHSLCECFSLTLSEQDKAAKEDEKSAVYYETQEAIQYADGRKGVQHNFHIMTVLL